MMCNLNACRSKNASTRLHGCIARASSEWHSASSCVASRTCLFAPSLAKPPQTSLFSRAHLDLHCIRICHANAKLSGRESHTGLTLLCGGRRARESKLTRRWQQSYRGIERFQRLRRHRRQMPGLWHLADEHLSASPNSSRRDIVQRVALRLVARITTRSHRSLRM